MQHLGPEAERYLREVVEGQPLWVREEITEELRGHLTDAIERRVSQGADRDTAEREAVHAFGPVVELQRDLARVRRPRALSNSLLGGLLDMFLGWWVRQPFDVLAPLKLLMGRPIGLYQWDYALGRYDAIIARGEHELRTRGARFNLHHELGLAYNAIGEHERALGHLSAEVEWLQGHPLPRFLGRQSALATAYSNLAGVLETLGRDQETDDAISAGLALDPRHGMLHLQRAKRRIAGGDQEKAVRDIEALLADRRMRPHSLLLLFVRQDPAFGPLRENPDFQRLLLRAAA